MKEKKKGTRKDNFHPIILSFPYKSHKKNPFKVIEILLAKKSKMLKYNVANVNITDVNIGKTSLAEHKVLKICLVMGFLIIIIVIISPFNALKIRIK